MLFADNTLYSAVYQKHCASAARSHFAVDSSSINRNSPFCRLTNRILLRMDCTHAMIGYSSVLVDCFFQKMTYFITMRKSGRRTNITGNKNLMVARNNTATSTAVAGRSFCNCAADFHKIFIPSWTYVFFFNHFCILKKAVAQNIFQTTAFCNSKRQMFSSRRINKSIQQQSLHLKQEFQQILQRLQQQPKQFSLILIPLHLQK